MLWEGEVVENISTGYEKYPELLGLLETKQISSALNPLRSTRKGTIIIANI
jgi:hypothetical protein